MSTTERDELTKCDMIGRDGKWFVEHQAAKAIVDDLMAKLDAATRERDELDATNKSMSRLNVNAVAYIEKVEEKLAQAREQLEAVQAELVEAERQLTDWMDTAEALYKAVPVAYERGQLTENGSRKPSEMVKEYLAEVRAEAAAMREVIEMITVHRRVTIYGAADAWRDKAEKALSGTAGRDLLDEVRRKDERIKELEAELADTKAAIEHQGTLLESQGEKITAHQDVVQKKDRVIESLLSHPLSSPRNIAATAELIKAMADQLNRFERKCSTAKAALVEARERVAELEAQIRDGVKAAYDAAEKAFDAKEWADDQPTPEPVWQYRRWNNETPGFGVAIWRTIDGNSIESSFDGRFWSVSAGFSSWRECCDDASTYPCDEYGKPLVKGPSREWLEKMADAEDQCESVTAISPELLEAVECEHDTSGKPCPCNPVVEDYSKCQSCGVAWHDHLGPTGVCKQLQDVVQFLKNQMGLVQDGDKWGVWGEGGNAVYGSIVDALDAAVQLNVEQLKKAQLRGDENASKAAMLDELRELLRKDYSNVVCFAGETYKLLCSIRDRKDGAA